MKALKVEGKTSMDNSIATMDPEIDTEPDLGEEAIPGGENE